MIDRKRKLILPAMLILVSIVHFPSAARAMNPSSVFDDFNGSQLSSQWTTHPFGGVDSTFSEANGILHLTSTGPMTSGLNVGTPYTPTGDNLTLTARVKANSFGRFHLALVSQEPSTDYSTVVAALELDLTGSLPTDCGNSGAAIRRIGPSDNYSVFTCNTSVDTWYRVQIVAMRNPWLVTYNFLNDSGSLIATASATDPNFSFSNIQYIDLAVWCGWSGCSSNYDVDWISTGTAPAVPGFQQMYLLNITSVYGVVCQSSPSSCQLAADKSRELSELARNHGYSLKIVSTFDAWDALLRSPPNGITVLSAMWNYMLIPKSWQNTTWQGFYVYVANTVRLNGWIINSEDWPFYTYYREGDPSPQMPGPAATETFFSVVHASMDAWTDNITPDISNITQAGRTAAVATGLTFPDAFIGPGVFNHRAVQWTGITPVITFYQTESGNYGVRYPASAIQMGSGFFVHVQWNENITLTADMIFAFATILTYNPAFLFDWADSNNDGKITIVDLANTALCFGVTSNSTLWTQCGYWDLYGQNKVTILGLATVAILFGQISYSNAFPGQGQPPNQLDPFWATRCNFLTGTEQAYCQRAT